MLNFRQWGEPGRQKVVLLHGLFGDLDNLGQAARSLAEHFHVLTPDLPNHGASPHTPGMSLGAMACDLAALLDNLTGQDERFHLVGHSLGGKLAMHLALDVPSRIQSLCVIDIAPVRYTQSRHNQVFAALKAVEQARPADRRAAEALMAPMLPDAGVRQFLLKGFLRAEARSEAGNGSCWRFNLAAIAASYGALMGWEHEQGSFDGPTLFIKGGDSDYMGAEHQSQIVALFPAAKARIVAGAGHWLHAEQPQLFQRLLRDFLEQAR